ncbi:cyclase family protein [Amycolatopsis sp. NPDC005232]|uniref:cyclase family protein n=1 Tax=Amycolatopsis sp. NPDC005232 TaxID=3157027 RepID=UPI0033AF078F
MTDEVPAVAHLLAGAPRNWGRWGEDDEVGTLNHLGPAEVLAGLGTVRQGRVFTLQTPMFHENGDPSSPARAAPRRYMVQDQGSWYGPEPPDLPGGARYADDVVVSHLQGSTQYDALGHVWYDDTLYNGYDAATTIGGLRKASVLPIAERGVVGRGVLVDMAGFRGKRHLDRDETFTHEDLAAAAAAQGVEIRPHDVLLINTGWLEFFYSVPREEFFGESYQEPGLVYTPELAEWFQSMEIANLATDTIGNEVLIDPRNGTTLLVHCALMRNLGLVFTEICDLRALVADCRADGQWDFLYAAAPLKVVGGTGSPVNPIVVK